MSGLLLTPSLNHNLKTTKVIMISRVFPSYCALVLVLFFDLANQAQATEEHPNVVVILTDDQGWGDLSIHGNKNLSTPNVDSLARDGAMFERFYVCPVCSPTRAEFLTGRYHDRSGVYSTSTGGERLDLDEMTIAQTFKAADYATAAFGKWHNGMQYPYHPNARGFDEFYGFCSGHWGHYFSPSLEHDGQLVRGNGFVIDDFTDHAIEFVKKNRDRPFFCYLPFNTPHSPMQVPDRHFEKFAPPNLQMLHRDPEAEDVPKTRAALAMCENIDWNVGRVLKALDDLKISEKTMVVFFTDNGPNSYRWNGDMRGRKGSTDEGGTRVPCLIRWPGKIQGGTKVKQLASATDLLPTLADLAGIDVASQKPLDGISLKPILLDGQSDWTPRTIVTSWKGRTSIRSQRYHLDNTGKLYDLNADPGQRINIANQNPVIVTRLAHALTDWKKDVLSEVTPDDRPFPVGYPKFPTTHLPARDAIAHGEIKRSARAPNCSFFTNWTSTSDFITWDVDVETTGRYEATIYYTCPAEEVGSKIELVFGNSRITGSVTEAHDPPLVGAEHDRVPRKGESLVKAFNPLKLGNIELKKGRGQLKLGAVEVASEQVMDVRYVVLTLIEE